MPFTVKKQPDGKYKLWNSKKKEYAKPSFNTKDSAISQGKNYMRYRGETPIVKGNKILSS